MLHTRKVGRQGLSVSALGLGCLILVHRMHRRMCVVSDKPSRPFPLRLAALFAAILVLSGVAAHV